MKIFVSTSGITCLVENACITQTVMLARVQLKPLIKTVCVRHAKMGVLIQDKHQNAKNGEHHVMIIIHPIIFNILERMSLILFVSTFKIVRQDIISTMTDVYHAMGLSQNLASVQAFQTVVKTATQSYL